MANPAFQPDRINHGFGPLVSHVLDARLRLAGHIRHTPLVPCPGLSALAGHTVALKLDLMQETGSFKLRGATNRILTLPPQRRARGVVTASTGNHGRAVAHAAARLGLRAVVCLSALVPANKVEAVRALGAEVRIVGRSQDDATVEAQRLVREEGMAWIAPFDDPAVVAGQGTLGFEVVEDLPEVATVLVPLSGGGLAGGVALAVKTVRPKARVVGISMERGAAMHASLMAGRPVDVEERPTLADSLGGGIGLANRCTFDLCRDLLDDVVLLTEAEIAAGMRHLHHCHGLTAEGAAAVGPAALLAGKVRLDGPAVCLVTGGNVDRETFRRVIEAADAESAAATALHEAA